MQLKIMKNMNYYKINEISFFSNLNLSNLIKFNLFGINFKNLIEKLRKRFIN